VIAEMSIALVLLAGAGLMARSFAALQHLRLGFEPAHVLTANVALSRRRYPTDTTTSQFYHARSFAAERRLPRSESPSARRGHWC
jgi:hypothetical protein